MGLRGYGRLNYTDPIVTERVFGYFRFDMDELRTARLMRGRYPDLRLTR